MCVFKTYSLSQTFFSCFIHFSLQCPLLPPHLCQFLSHLHPLIQRLEEKWRVQEAERITHRLVELRETLKMRYAWQKSLFKHKDVNLPLLVVRSFPVFPFSFSKIFQCDQALGPCVLLLVLWVVQYSDIMRFQFYCVDVAKCLPHLYCDQNPNWTVINEVLWLKTTPWDAFVSYRGCDYAFVLPCVLPESASGGLRLSCGHYCQ